MITKEEAIDVLTKKENMERYVDKANFETNSKISIYDILINENSFVEVMKDNNIEVNQESVDNLSDEVISMYSKGIVDFKKDYKIFINDKEFIVDEATATEIHKIIDVSLPNKKNELKKQGLSYLHNDSKVLKIFDGVNTIKKAEKDLLNNYEHKTACGDTFHLIGTEKETAQELIKNYGNEMQKDLLFFILKATETGKSDFEFENEEYFKTMGITNQPKNKKALEDRLKTYNQTEYTVYYEHKGKKTFVKSPIITYTQKGTWANRKDGTRELFWKSTHVEMKWLGDIMRNCFQESKLLLLDNDIFSKVGSKNKGSNFVSLYVKLEHLYRNNVNNLNKEHFNRISIKKTLENLMFTESTIKAKGFTQIIKEPLEAFMDDFYDWHYENGVHNNRTAFESDFIFYRPKKFKLKIKEYPKKKVKKTPTLKTIKP